jgi:hypothetical protein
VMLAVGGLTACTAEVADSTASESPSTTSPGTTAARDDESDIPVMQGSSHDWAVADFGADEVAAAVSTVERMVRIALADCRRWTTGEVDPELVPLVTAELLDRALEELDRSKEYGGMSPPRRCSPICPTTTATGTTWSSPPAVGVRAAAPCA